MNKGLRVSKGEQEPDDGQSIQAYYLDKHINFGEFKSHQKNDPREENHLSQGSSDGEVGDILHHVAKAEDPSCLFPVKIL